MNLGLRFPSIITLNNTYVLYTRSRDREEDDGDGLYNIKVCRHNDSIRIPKYRFICYYCLYVITMSKQYENIKHVLLTVFTKNKFPN